MQTYEKMFYEALRIRMVEERIIEIYPSDKIQSPVHLSIGQEHHVVGFCTALASDDQLFATYRSHAPYLAKGGDLKLFFAELYGKLSGISKGKAGSMHLCAPDVGFMGSSAIVGATISHALGAAYSFKIKGQSRIAVAIIGDGATEEGVFHECLNFASLKDLPILFVIENNGLSIHSHIHARQSYDLKDLLSAYKINYLKEDDGFDMDSIYEKTKEIRNKMIKESRPFVFEIKTYRYKSHVGVENDFDKGYRHKHEFEEWYLRDPLVINKPLIRRFRKEIMDEIDEAVEFAERSEHPHFEELHKDVY